MTAIPPLAAISGVGPGLAARLERFDLFDLRDLLLYPPYRYEDRSRLVPLDRLEEGRPALVEGEVLTSEVVGKQKPQLVCRLIDRTGAITLRFFTIYPGLRNRLTPGSRWRCYGVPRFGNHGFEMVHPELVSPEEPLAVVPIYPTGTGLSQKTLRRLISKALPLLEEGPDWLPEIRPDLFARFGLEPLPLRSSTPHLPPRWSSRSAGGSPLRSFWPTGLGSARAGTTACGAKPPPVASRTS